MEKISKAIEFAARAHDGQRRRGSETPYILHPVEVAAIVATMTDDQDVMAAAALHDVVEDCGVAPEEVEREFGARVRELVMAETENKRDELPPEDTWLVRKQEAVDFVTNATDLDVKRLYLGDKLSNLRSVDKDYLALGEVLWQRFHHTDPNMHKWYYRSIAEGTRELADTQAWQEFDRLITKVFG